MKDFVVNVVDKNNKPHLFRTDAKDEKDAAKQAIDHFSSMFGKLTVRAVVDIEKFPGLDKILTIIHTVDEFELKQLEKEAAEYRKQKEIERKAEELRKSKFKKYNKDGLTPAMREKIGAEVLKNAEKGELSSTDWNRLLSALTDEQRKELRDQLMKDAKDHWKDDTQNLKKETQFIDYIFGTRKGHKNKIASIRDIAEEWGTSHVYVVKVTKQAFTKVIKCIKKIALKRMVNKMSDVSPEEIKTFDQAMNYLKSL